MASLARSRRAFKQTARAIDMSPAAQGLQSQHRSPLIRKHKVERGAQSRSGLSVAPACNDSANAEARMQHPLDIKFINEA